jgi:hypothetical protein
VVLVGSPTERPDALWLDAPGVRLPGHPRIEPTADLELPMDVPETRYVKTDDGLYIGYQVFGAGPYDLVWNDTMANLDANWGPVSPSRMSASAS